MAEPRARRELELRLKVTTDAAAAKAGMDQLAQSAERAERATTKAQRAATAGGGGVVGGRAATGGMTGVVGGTAAPAGGGVRGFVGGAGEMLAARFGITPGIAGPAAAALVAAQAARTGKAAADAYQDEMLTAGQRARKIVGSVAGGDTFLSFADTFTGRGRDMIRAQEEGQRAAAVSAARTQFLGTQLGLQAGVMTSRAQADALNSASPTRVPYIDRSTATGERQFRLETQRAQIAERAAAADRAAAVAKEDAEAAARRANSLEQEGLRLDQRRAEVQRQVDGTPAGRSAGRNASSIGLAALNPIAGFIPDALDEGGPARVRQLNELERIGVERQSNAAMQAEQLRAVQEARNRQIAAEGQSRAAQVGNLGVRAADFEDRAARASSNAQRVALSDRDRVQEAIYAAERFKRGGLRALDPSEISLLQEFGGDDLRAAAERDGKNDPRLRRLAGLLPQTYQDGAADPESFRRRANETRNQAAELQLDIDRETANATANVVKTVADTIERVLLRALEQVEANMRNRQLGSRGSQ